MAKAKRYLAFDLGAESGRAIAGTIAGGRISLDVLHRFPNGPIRLGDTIYWDVLGIFRELKAGLAAYAAKYGREVASLATDSWGVDFALLDRRGALLGNPVHYRDARTNGMVQALSRVVPLDRLYGRTGIQIMQINSVFQLFSMVKARSPVLDRAASMLHIADLLNGFLCGSRTQEYTLASTSQLLDPVKRTWDKALARKLGIPTAILPKIVMPGTVVGTLYDHVAEECGVRPCPLVATGNHDTASAVAAVPAEGDDWLYISSGTWSLIGAELPKPLVTPASREANFTNEGGVCGTIRLLKNLAGMWIIQQCRATWERKGKAYDYGQLARMAEKAPPLKCLIDPNADVFAAPGDMPSRIAEFCRRTGQAAPAAPGEFVRTALESLALAYRAAVESVETVTGRTYRVLHIVGGGSQNNVLNRFAADATGKVVKTGPVEATALGNCLMQAIGTGSVRSLAAARRIVRDSFTMKTFRPSAARSAWDRAYQRYRKLRS